MRTNLQDTYTPFAGPDVRGNPRTGVIVSCSHGGVVWLADSGRLQMQHMHLRTCAELRALVGTATGLGGDA